MCYYRNIVDLAQTNENDQEKKATNSTDMWLNWLENSVFPKTQNEMNDPGTTTDCH